MGSIELKFSTRIIFALVFIISGLICWGILSTVFYSHRSIILNFVGDEKVKSCVQEKTIEKCAVDYFEDKR